MENIIILAVLIIVTGLAGFYIYRAKKKGKKCIGCPNSCNCSCRECPGSCKNKTN